MFNNFVRLFHIAILATIFLSGCGYKLDPVYTMSDGKNLEYNSTESSGNTANPQRVNN